jgi:Protein of unknown function (DUF4231)
LGMRTMSLPPNRLGPNASPAEILIDEKHREYARAARTYCILYYLIRLTAGLSAGVIPFVVSSQPPVAVALSVAIVVCTVVDLVFSVQDRWQLMSKATDLLTAEQMRASGDYDKFKDRMDILLTTEAAKFNRLVDIDDVLNKARNAAAQPQSGSPKANP